MNDVIEPLVLVVDDQARNRKLHEEGLRDAGCQTIGVESRAEALASLRDGPSIDLIVTDIHLGMTDTRGGVDLALRVKTAFDAELPIAAYSAIVSDDELQVPEGLFEARRQRGNLSYDQMVEFNEECRTLALGHRANRIERSRSRSSLSAAKQNRLKRVGSKSFTLAGIDELELAIVSLGYSLRLISSEAFGDLAETVPVWVRNIDGMVEAQVCGQPYLHWQARDEAAALRGLVESMVAYAMDLEVLPSPAADGGMARLKTFLRSVVAVDGSRS